MPEHKIVKQGISHVPEGRRMFSNLTVLENLKMGAYTRKDKQEINNSLEMVYERFPRLKERTRQLAGTLSGGEQQIILNDENVTSQLRQEEVGNMASKSSANPKVREKLLQLQRDIARDNDVIMDGRDIGTFVLPNADVKVYLTASVEERAKRRYLELEEKGMDADMSKIEQDIRTRDFQDMNRSIAPLKQAEDAVVIDSSQMSIPEVMDRIVDAFQESLKLKG